MKMRLDKLVSTQGASRKEAKEAIKSGRVWVDGVVVRNGAQVVDVRLSVIEMDGTPIVYREAMHLMLHKPAGVITAAEDTRHETVMALLPAAARAQGCMPVGRLDIDTEGLLLFTTDGQLAHRLLAPKRLIPKVYEVVVDIPLDVNDMACFESGVVCSDFTAMPALLQIAKEDACKALVTVHEGKFHQIKRMFAAQGKRVEYLKRLCFGGIWLDAGLPRGAFRELTREEALMLYNAAGMLQKEG